MNNMPTVTKNLLIINIFVYLFTSVLSLRGIDLNDMGGLHFFMASDFHLYQLLTYQFLHGSFWHLFANMFALWMFGRIIENVWGEKKFLFYYISCGIGAGLVQEAAQYANFVFSGLADYDYVNLGGTTMAVSDYVNLWTTIGASGSVYAILLAFGMLFPNERLFIIPFPFPIKAKWLVVGYIAIELFSAMGTSGDGVAHMAHLGGMFFGWLMIRYWNRHPDSWNRSGGQQFFDQLRSNFERHRNRQGGGSHRDSHLHAERGGRAESDWEYNARKKANQEEIDRILDKIRKSGYDSLTKEEKQTLFDNRN